MCLNLPVHLLFVIVTYYCLKCYDACTGGMFNTTKVKKTHYIHIFVHSSRLKFENYLVYMNIQIRPS